MEGLAALGSIGILVFVFVLVVLGIIMPISAYSAQKWAYKCFLELQKLNAAVELVIARGEDRLAAVDAGVAPTTWGCLCGAENAIALETCPKCRRARNAFI